MFTFQKVPLFPFLSSFLSSSRTGHSNEMDGWLNEYNNNFMFHFFRMSLSLVGAARWRPFYCNLCLTWWWDWILMGYESGWMFTDKSYSLGFADWATFLRLWRNLFAYLMLILHPWCRFFASLMQTFRIFDAEICVFYSSLTFDINT